MTGSGMNGHIVITWLPVVSSVIVGSSLHTCNILWAWHGNTKLPYHKKTVVSLK